MKRKYLLLTLVIIVIVFSSASTYLFFSSNVGETTYKSASQSTPYVTEYQTKSNNSSPNAIAVDSKGNVWFVLGQTASLAELIPSNNTIHEFQIPEPNKTSIVTWGIAVDSSRHLVWFTDGNGNLIWRFNMTDGSFLKYQVKTKFALPYDLALDGFGNVWFTELAGKVGEINTSGQLNETTIPVPSVEATGIAVDSSNKIWINFGKLGSFLNESSFYVASYFQGQFQIFNMTGRIIEPQGLAVDSKGNLWITQHGPSLISEFNPSDGYFRSISTSVPSWAIDQSTLPYFIDTDSKDNIWFSEHYGNAIGVFFPSNQSLIEYVVPSRVLKAGNLSFTLTLGLAPNGQPWFTEFLTGRVGVVNTSAPVEVSLVVSNNSSSTIILNRSSATLDLRVSNNSTETAVLGAYNGNLTEALQINFSKSSGTGNFQSTMTIARNSNTTSGVYFVTISAETQSVIYSKVLEIVVRKSTS